jgi:hypothetical protein
VDACTMAVDARAASANAPAAAENPARIRPARPVARPPLGPRDAGRPPLIIAEPSRRAG